MRELHRDLSAPGDWELELVRVPAASPIQLDLRLESVMDGVLVSGTLHASLTADCGRCLEPVSDTLDVSVTELFGYQPDPADDELPVLDGDYLDLEPVLHDAVVLALPLNPVCDNACAGLCATCGERLADAGPDHRHESLDARWGVLSALQSQTPPSSATMENEPTIESPREN